jgi:hypothetical protein
MKFNKKVFLLLLLLIFIVSTIDILAYHAYVAYVNESIPDWFHFVVLIIGSVGGYAILKFKDSHSAEYSKADKILNSSQVRYSWYALFFFLLWLAAYLIFVFVQMKR